MLHGQTGDAVLADKAYDSNALRAIIAEIGATAVIPSNRTRKVINPHDATIYRQRNRIETAVSNTSGGSPHAMTDGAPTSPA